MSVIFFVYQWMFRMLLYGLGMRIGIIVYWVFCPEGLYFLVYIDHSFSVNRDDTGLLLHSTYNMRLGCKYYDPTLRSHRTIQNWKP
jgi:hypothetical protein